MHEVSSNIEIFTMPKPKFTKDYQPMLVHAQYYLQSTSSKNGLFYDLDTCRVRQFLPKRKKNAVFFRPEETVSSDEIRKKLKSDL